MKTPNLYIPSPGYVDTTQHKDIISIYPLPEGSSEMLLLDNGMNLHVIPKSDFPNWQHRIDYNHPRFNLLEDIACFSVSALRKRLGMQASY